MRVVRRHGYAVIALLMSGAGLAACHRRHIDESAIARTDEVDTVGPDVSPAPNRSVVVARGRGPIAVGPSSIAFTNQYSGGSNDNELLELSKNGGVPALRAKVHFPRGFALGEEAFYFLDEGPFTLYRDTDNGTTVLAGDKYYAAYWKDHDPIRVRDGYVYWLSGRTATHEPGIMRIPETGGVAVLVLEVQGGANGLDVDAARIYVTTRDGVLSASVRGGGVRVLAPADRGMEQVAVNGSHVYWLSFEPKDIEAVDFVWQLNRVPLTGGAREVVVGRSKSPHLFTLTSRAIYWVDWHDIHRADLDGRNDATLESADGWAIAADDANVYFTNGGEIRRLAQ